MRGKARDVIKSLDQNQEFNTETDSISKQIVELQKKNLELYSENQCLSLRYDHLTSLNQELGNDIACFDKDIGILERNIQEKYHQFEKCCQESNDLRQTLSRNRNSFSASDLKPLEHRKKKLLRQFNNLIQSKTEIRQVNSLKCRANQTQKNQLIDDHNKELLDQIDLLRSLVNKDYSPEQKQNILNEKLKRKESERFFIQKQIDFLKNPPNDNLIEVSEKSELADDEEAFSSNSIKLSQESEKEITKRERKALGHSETKPKPNDFRSQKSFNSDVIRRKKCSENIDNSSFASSSSFLFESYRPTGQQNQNSNSEKTLSSTRIESAAFEKVDIGIQLDEYELDTTIVRRTSTLEINNKAILSSLKQILKERIEQEKLIENQLNRFTTQFKVSSLTIYADPLKHITNTKIRTTASNQTELTNDMIEFYSNLMNGTFNSDAIYVSQTIEELQNGIQEKSNQISILKFECEKRDDAIKRVQDEISLQQKSSSNNSNDEYEYQLKVKMSSDINTLKNEASTQRALYHSTVEENAKLMDQLDALQLKRIELEREVDSISSKEKLELEELTEKVETLEKAADEAKKKLIQAKNELNTKRTEMNSLKTSKENSEYHDLYLKKNKLERRLFKWKYIIKEAAEHAQYLRDFSQNHIVQRNQLKELVDKYENEVFEKYEDLLIVKKYQLLLNSMQNELTHNWI